MCFYKSSSAQIYTSRPLKLESSPHVVPLTAYAVSSKAVKEEGFNGKHEAHAIRKGCIRKPSFHPVVEKKRVKWIDDYGKDLAEIKEFESSDVGDADDEEESGCCVCVIL